MKRFLLAVLLSTTGVSTASAQQQLMEYAPTPVRGGSWDVLAGGVPSGDHAQAELGFSQLRLGYHRALSKRLTVGGAVAFDYAYWAPADSFGSALTIGAPVRFSAYKSGRFSLGLTGEPSLYFGFAQPRFSQFILGLGLGVGANAGWRIERWLQVGIGVDVPMLIGLPVDGRDAYVAFPILVGPTAELYVSDDWAFTGEAKIGPHVVSDDFYGTRFGMSLVVGVAKRM